MRVYTLFGTLTKKKHLTSVPMTQSKFVKFLIKLYKFIMSTRKHIKIHLPVNVESTTWLEKLKKNMKYHLVSFTGGNIYIGVAELKDSPKPQKKYGYVSISHITGNPSYSLQDVMGAISGTKIYTNKTQFVAGLNKLISAEQDWSCDNNEKDCNKYKKEQKRMQIDEKYYEKYICNPSEYVENTLFNMDYNKRRDGSGIKYNKTHIHPDRNIFPEGTYLQEDDVDAITYFSFNDNYNNIIIQEVTTFRDIAPNITFCVEFRE